MTKEEQYLLEFLLNTYEKSKSFKENTNTNKRILATFYGKGNSKFSKYIIEDFETKIAYNEACICLKKDNLIDFQWVSGNANNIIEKVWLIKENIPLAYQKINRVPKSDYLISVLNILDDYSRKLGSGWILDCVTEWKKSIENNRSVGNFLPVDIEQIKDYLEVIVGVDTLNGTEILERVFSQKTLKSSKKFELMYRNRLISLIKKKFNEMIDFNEISDKEVLELVGIVRYPEQISFCGSLSLITKNNEIIKFSSMTNGAYINAKDIDMFDFIIGEDITKIITIENMANFYDYITTKKKNDELVIYHGGCFSPSKGRFFKKITEIANPKIKFFHWGDIDFGGFSMLKRLRLEINDKYQALYMSKECLIEYETLATNFNSDYSKKLVSLLKSNAISDCHSCIRYMLEKNIRLEQESMIIY